MPRIDTPSPTRPTAFDRPGIGYLLEAAWMALLILPFVSRLPDTLSWSVHDAVLVVAPFWLLVLARAAFPGAGFFPATYPLAVIGILVVGASTMRAVDAFDLALQWRTYSRAEIVDAVGPYAGMTLASLVLLAALCWAAWRHAPRRTRHRRACLFGACATVAAAASIPAATLVSAWPVEPVLLTGAIAVDSHWLANRVYPEAVTFDPRDPAASWNASRIAGAPATETIVMIVGESVRNDFLHECGGPALVRPFPADALVACDVVSGADHTAMSVPLLVSREMPGHPVRVSSDGTFLHALRESGFETHWYASQQQQLAWPDAQHQDFSPRFGNVDDHLLQPLDAALRGSAALKAIVLHTYNAHAPFCDRFDPARAPYPADCTSHGRRWGRDSLSAERVSYADAVDATVGFLNQVIARLQQQPEPAFLVYSPDHGEALMDDGREIYGHARHYPTRWDTHVPAIFWANAAWHARYATQWANLAAQKDRPLMHMDLVPTLMGAAGVRYDEPRGLPVNLLAASVPTRHRRTQVAVGRFVDWQVLVDEAAAAGPFTPTPDDPRTPSND